MGTDAERKGSFPLGSGEQSQISVSPQARPGLPWSESALRAVVLSYGVRSRIALAKTQGFAPRTRAPVPQVPCLENRENCHIDYMRPMAGCNDIADVMSKAWHTQLTSRGPNTCHGAKLNDKTSGWDGPLVSSLSSPRHLPGPDLSPLEVLYLNLTSYLT